jgi:UDP-GlcNAc:undecaprenyl-phosphate GlcNAc-1-phosphate transferase
MRVIVYLGVAGVAAVVSFVLSLVIHKLSHRYRLYPKIRSRDVHTRPTPRLGGIAMFLGVVAAFGVGSLLPQFSLVFSEPGKVLAVLGAALMIVLLGVADDIWDLDWLTKLAGQIIAAGLLAWQGVQIGAIPIPGSLALLSPYMSLAITVLAVVLVMNAINFIDGLDGLVAGVAIIANGVFAVYVYVISRNEQNDYFNLAQFVTVILIGACIGFLPLNWHPARLFMGDAGALLVGLLMATSTLAVTGQIDPTRITGGRDVDVLGASGLVPAFIPILLPFAVLVIPLLDFGLAVFRRLRAGKSPFSADRKHLHHRLLDMGHTHFHAVLIFYGWTASASVGCFLFLIIDWWWALAVTLVALVICTLVTLAPVSRRKRLEAAVQRAGASTVDDEPALAQFDPLDAAADGVDDPAEPSEIETRDALDRLQPKDAPA